MVKDDRLYLTHMLRYAQNALRSLGDLTHADLVANEDAAELLIYRLLMIGETARQVSKETKDRFPSIVWADIVGMRNRLIHEYIKVDLRVVWQTAKNDLPYLIKEVKAVLAELKVQ